MRDRFLSVRLDAARSISQDERQHPTMLILELQMGECALYCLSAAGEIQDCFKVKSVEEGLLHAKRKFGVAVDAWQEDRVN